MDPSGRSRTRTRLIHRERTREAPSARARARLALVRVLTNSRAIPYRLLFDGLGRHELPPRATGARREAHLPAEQPQASQEARLPSAHADTRWPCDPFGAPSQGPPRDRGLNAPATEPVAFVVGSAARDAPRSSTGVHPSRAARLHPPGAIGPPGGFRCRQGGGELRAAASGDPAIASCRCRTAWEHPREHGPRRACPRRRP